MPISFTKLLKLFDEKGITSYTVKKHNIMSQSAYTKMRNGQGNIDTRTIERLCEYLDCQPGDLMEYIKEDGTAK